MDNCGCTLKMFYQTFESITVLFVELANIDITAENAMEMVNCMNTAFSLFDTISDRHPVYKVRMS